jgi:hypothetical protein
MIGPLRFGYTIIDEARKDSAESRMDEEGD